MANTFINPTVVAKECVRQLKNNCVMGNLVYRGFEKEYTMLHGGWKPGSHIHIKTPVYFRTHTGRDISSSVVDLLEQETRFTVETWAGVAFQINSTEATQDIDIFAKRFIKPAMQAIANRIDSSLLYLYAHVCNQVGTPNETPQSLMPYLQAHAKLTEHAVPVEDRSCVINPQAKIYLADAITSVFNQPMVGAAVERAQFGNIAGFDMYESQNVKTHQPGSAAGEDLGTIKLYENTLDDDAGIRVRTGGSWISYPWENWYLNVGDIFTVPSLDASKVNTCNPISGQDLGYERQFSVYSVHDHGGFGTVLSFPGVDPYNIRSSSSAAAKLPYQTVTNLPKTNDPLAIVGTTSKPYTANLTFHKDAFGMVMLPIELPVSINWKAIMSQDGYTVSVSRYFAGNTLKETIRFDVLYGTKVLNPFMACRIAG